MFTLRGNPWRCWERLTLAGVLHGPAGLLVRVSLFDTESRVYQSEFRWPALVRLGPNDFRGHYAQVTLRFGRVDWSFEAADSGERVFVLVRALDPAAARNVEVRVETLFLPYAAGELVTREREVIARNATEAWCVRPASPTARRSGTTIINPLSRPTMIVIEPAPDFGRRQEQRTEAEPRSAASDAPLAPEERAIAGAVGAARRAYLRRFSYVPAELWWAYAPIPYGIGWNTIWAADRREPLVVCSRDWCVHGSYGDWVLFNWDQFLLVPAAADFDRELAHQIIRPQFAVQLENGLVPGIASPMGVSHDRGMPPVSALSLWKAHLRSGDRSFVDEYYEPLLRYHDWWSRSRDGNHDGLLEWGSDPVRPVHPQWQAHTAWASRYETGMDNHPMWDDISFSEETHTQDQSDVGLNALHVADGECLARMAELRGAASEASRLRDEAAKRSRLVEERLWNEAAGLWLSRRWDGRWKDRASPCCLYPLLMAGVDASHARRAIDDHLRNPRRFGGRYVMPVSPRDDPAYPEQYYVRGRIWPAQTLLVHQALREARCEEAAVELAQGCLRTFRGEWLDEGHLHENYHAETADGDDTPESDPLYSFGLMLPMAAWNQLRDVRTDGTEARCDPSVLGEHLDTDGRLRARIEPLEGLPEPA